MSFLKLSLPAGMVRPNTVYEAAGRWYSGVLVRWFQGLMMPEGGWTARTTTPCTGKARALFTWRDNVGLRYIGVGTHSKLYALTQTMSAPVDITPAGFTTGRADATTGGGYGVGLYGSGTYGTPRVDNVSVQDASVWTLDNWGERLVGCMSDDGKLYEWALDIATPTVAAAISGAPTSNQGLVVTPEYILMALGAGGNPRKIQWCDQETNTSWTPSATNQAGDYILQSRGRLMCGRRIRGGTMLFCDTDVHFASYIGLPYVYGIERIGENCGIISRNAVAVADSRAIWMSQNGFYAFDGSVQPVDCDVYDAVFGDLNLTQRSKITCTQNAAFNEVRWDFPSSASTENDTYVVYNYAEGHWRVGSLSTQGRLCGNDRGVFSNPIMADASGYLYDHETGYSYGALTPYAESGPVELGNGDNIMRARRLIADEKTVGDVTMSFKVRDWPGDSEATYGPYTLTNPVTVRFSGRQVRLVVTGDELASWRVGTPRLDLQEGGKRRAA